MPSMMEKILEKIKSRGYWRAVIRPSKFEKERISELGKCKTLVRDNAVYLRGWDYPHYDMGTEPSSGLNYVEQFTDWGPHIEVWRLYQSGQFIHYKALWEDWEDLSHSGQTRQIPPNGYLEIIATMYLLTEIYEFASRLSAKGILGDSCEIQITLSNTMNRKLESLEPGSFFYSEYRTTLNEIPRAISLPTTDLMTRSAELSLDHVAYLYHRFNWDNFRAETFKELQREFLEKK